jgi:multidrug efflux pump subunit AcrB
MNNQSMLIVQFYVGEDVERSIVKLYNELMKNMDKMPQGVSMPLIKTRAIDDVPVMGITLSSKKYDDNQLKMIAENLASEIKKINNVSDINILGGRSSEINVKINKEKLAFYHINFSAIADRIQSSNIQLNSGNLLANNETIEIRTGNFLSSKEDVENLIVGEQSNVPIYLKQIATVSEGAETSNQYVFFGEGKASNTKNDGLNPAVTLAIAKKKGADAMLLSSEINSQLNQIKNQLIPSEIKVNTTRNYGETASHKVSELLLHLIVAIVVVTLFVMLAMGWRGGLVVFLSVPVTFALTLLSYYFLDYTLNRITLFALVFITGIVVDDSIIIAENMHRHFKMKKLPFMQAAIFAINEVGNPTILATFTVIAAVLPMAFVSGLMGPYMSPMPIGASIAMMLSLIVALTLTPYLGYLFLHKKEDSDLDKEHKLEDSKIYKLYSSIIQPLLENRWKRWSFMLVTLIALFASSSMFYTKSVAVKMLPFDNKNEFQIVIDMPEGSPLEKTYALTKELADYVATHSMVVNVQGYVGTSGPISFNGLVRHYDLRRMENHSDIQVNLIDKEKRNIQSHEIVKSLRNEIQIIAKKYDANVKLVELPPGPPVLSTLVAEIYGPDYEEQIKIGNQIKELFLNTKDVVDVDWMVEEEQKQFQIVVNKEKASKRGISTAQLSSEITAVLSGKTAGVIHNENSFKQIPIKIELDQQDKSSIEDLKYLKITNQMGQLIQVSDVVDIIETIKPKSIYRKNQKRVVYVLADMAGTLESPSYAISNISENLNLIKLPKHYTLNEEYTKQPRNENQYTIKWDGEWQITYEVFRDLGIAFIVVLIVIYMLIVGWFQDFKTPIVMLTAIPLSLIGIVIGHWMLNAYFTATSMIGFIALAGVMVRNSVLLIDFIDIRLKEGATLKQSIVEAGAVRTTPILLTAGAVVLGAVIILFDPIFQGLAISLIGGTITSTFLTLIVVPLIYFKMLKKSPSNI